MPDSQPNQVVNKVIVAVHGIGDQTEFATIQQTTAQYCQYHLTSFAVPLGNYHNEQATYALPEDGFRQPGVRELGFNEALRAFIFAEVYWAPIPRQVVKEGYKLEDAQAWAKTIVGRVRQRAEARGKKFGEQEYSLLEEVLREMGETLGVLGQVFYLSGKLGLFSFDLDKILKDYLDDVQLVAEFKEESGQVIRRFSEKLEAIYRELTKRGVQPEIYLVTHSEGTVVALLGLLSAICGKDPVHGASRPPWLDCVRGWMTIGSPIDKHLLLWPDLFKGLTTPLHEPAEQAAKQRLIEWRNYYDLGDPVGFKLPKAREVFNTDPQNQQPENPWHWFNFPADHDHGFTRSLFPGKAHTDYWNDQAVFGHFMQKVIYQETPIPADCKQAKYDLPPKDRWLHKLGSWVLPYAAALGMLGFAVYTIYKAVQACLTPEGKEALETSDRIFYNVAGITTLLAGLTVTARLPRLTRDWQWRVVGVLIFLAGAFGYWKFTWDDEREHLGRLFINVLRDFNWGYSNTQLATWGVLGLVAVVALLANIVARRYPQMGVRPLLWFGGLGVLAIIAEHLINAPDARNEIWPVLLAGAFFLYLWWLVALFFDLVFVWHRYIQASVAQDRLNALGAVEKR